jgi:exodeoxyribonuclease-3
MTITIASVNVNGLRAAVKNGMHAWIDERQPDIITMQEVRCPDELVAELMGDGWHIAHAECNQKGRAGVAVASRLPIASSQIGSDHKVHNFTGRWIQSDIKISKSKTLSVVSAYVHTGDAESPERMTEKYAFFAAMKKRMLDMRSSGNLLLLTGDLNVAHKELDLKNWKGNLKSAGFLPEERAWFDEMFDTYGWVDVLRQHAGDVAGPYSWWSWRGKAFDNNAGWRIDYHIASLELAKTATAAFVDRAPSYDTRWSDHAPVIAIYDI